MGTAQFKMFIMLKSSDSGMRLARSETLTRTFSFLIIFLGLKAGLACFERITKGIHYMAHFVPQWFSNSSKPV